MRFVVVVVVLVAVCGVQRESLANDSRAVVEGGVLTLKKSDGIAMESEELSITPHRVDVAYVFRNTTSVDISTVVAFPMAPFVFQEGPLEGEDLEDARKQSWNTSGHFSVVVDGSAVTFETIAKVTPESVTVTHHWVQTFPAGKTVSVKHRFYPEGAFIYSFENETGLEGRLAREYCVGHVLARALKRRGEGTIFQVHYVLRTGANWKGPIGHFVLRIQKETAVQRASVCLDGIKKIDDRTFVLDKTRFIPTSDLKIAFIDPAQPPPPTRTTVPRSPTGARP
ncbi:MAG: DUF4424 family protein [Myxococcales bacterium]